MSNIFLHPLMASNPAASRVVEHQTDRIALVTKRDKRVRLYTEEQVKHMTARDVDPYAGIAKLLEFENRKSSQES